MASILAQWRATAAADPAAMAIRDMDSGSLFTRADLSHLGSTWSRAHGGGLDGQIVAFAEANGSEWLKVFLGLLYSGAVTVPLDTSEPALARRALAKISGASFLWSEGNLQTIAEKPRRLRDGTRLIKLTSGSTGTPRALRFTDDHMLADGRQVCASMDIRPSDVNLGCIPFGHSYGLGNLVMPLLMQGTAVVCGVAALPQALATAIAKAKPTVFPTVPALLRALAESDVSPKHLGSLRTVISAGAPLGADIAQAFRRRFGIKIHSFYGSSETGGITYDRTGDAALTARSVGTPLEGVEIIFGRGNRFSVKSAAVGGKGVFQSGDRGELTEAGELRLLGRSDRLLKIAGRRLDPAEIETALCKINGVREAWVTLHPTRTDVLAAVVAGEVASNGLRTALREHLASWKIPKSILMVPQLPLTSRGKSDTKKMIELLSRG